MARELQVLDIPLIAGADLSACQYTFVKLSAERTVVQCNGATDQAIGVLQNKPKSGEGAAVRTLGVTKVVLGTGGSTYGNRLGTDGSGDAVAKSSDGDIILGTALTTGSAGEIAEMLMPAVIQRAS